MLCTMEKKFRPLLGKRQSFATKKVLSEKSIKITNKTGTISVKWPKFGNKSGTIFGNLPLFVENCTFNL